MENNIFRTRARKTSVKTTVQASTTSARVRVSTSNNEGNIFQARVQAPNSGDNIFQKRVQAVTPKMLSDERIFVYVPKADNLGSVGIAGYNVFKVITENGEKYLVGDFVVSNQAIVSLPTSETVGEENAKYYTKQEIIDIYQRLDNIETGNAPTDDTTKYPSSHTVKSYVDAEAAARAAADEALQDNIDDVRSDLASEINTRAMADANLTNRIANEETVRANADNTLQSNINSEAQTRASADSALDTRVSDVEDIIPVQASSANQLADKSYVDARIASIQASRTYSFDTLEHFEAWLSREYERSDGLTIDELKIGNFILLEQTDVPDYWCKSTDQVEGAMTLEDNFSEVEVHIDLTPYQKKLQFDVLPTPTAQLVGQIYQYVGTTNSNYTNGKFYKVTYKNGQYVYEEPDYRPIVKPAVAPEDNSFIYLDENNQEHLASLGKGLAIVEGELLGGLELVE